MDPISHCLLGATAASLLAARKPEKLRVAMFSGGGAALLPDLDVFIRSSADPLLQLEYHRQFTHSLAFIPFGAGLAALLVFLVLLAFSSCRQAYGRADKQNQGTRFLALYLFCFAGLSTHGLLDACTSYGTLLLWPFSNERIAWSIIGIIDASFTLPLFVLLILLFFRKRMVYTRIAALYACFYLALGSLQHVRAKNMAEHSLHERKISFLQCAVKPSPLTLTLWRSICLTLHDEFITDAWYLGFFSGYRHYPGKTVRKFNVQEQAPWLKPHMRQYKDLRRFEWFSQGYIVAHPEYADVVGDLRYSMLPNRVDPLWGIVLDPDNTSDLRSTPFRSFRKTTSEDLGSFLRMALGRED